MASRIPNRTRSTSRERADEVEDIETQDGQEEAFDDEEEDADLAPALAERRGVAPAANITKRPWTDYLPRWIPSYVRNAIVELLKVTWPTRKEAVNLTITVVIFAVIFAIVFGLLDLGFTSGLKVITDRITHP